jgi:hypothetical protein
MGTFFRGRHALSYEPAFVQGAGRLLLAPMSVDEPAGPDDILVATAGATLYDPVTGWYDAGYTKTGINITRNNAEEEFDVDQIRGAIRRRPTTWEMSVGTQLAEASLESFQLGWELASDPVTGLPDITTDVNTAPALDVRSIGLGAPPAYEERRAAVAFQFPDQTLRIWYFHQTTHAPQEVGFTLNKTGEQVSLPLRLNCQAVGDKPVAEQFGFVFEQVAEPATP